MKLFASLFTMVIVATLLTGCQNTAQGLTKDITTNTKEIRKAINEN